MNNNKNFKRLKTETIKVNTKKYGLELTEKYGKETIRAANLKFKKSTKDQIRLQDELSTKINTLLIKAVKSADTSSELSTELCRSHQEWIQSYWPNYTKEAHMSLVEMYLVDDRFKKYYEDIICGGTLFLRDAMVIYLKLNK